MNATGARLALPEKHRLRESFTSHYSSFTLRYNYKRLLSLLGAVTIYQSMTDEEFFGALHAEGLPEEDCKILKGLYMDSAFSNST